MNIDGRPWRTIGLEPDGRSVWVIDQTALPYSFGTKTLSSCQQAAAAISTMVVRGAPLIGVTGAYGLMLALQADLILLSGISWPTASAGKNQILNYTKWRAGVSPLLRAGREPPTHLGEPAWAPQPWAGVRTRRRAGHLLFAPLFIVCLAT